MEVTRYYRFKDFFNKALECTEQEYSWMLLEIFQNGNRELYPIEVYYEADAILYTDEEIPEHEKKNFIMLSNVGLWLENSDTIHQTANNMLKKYTRNHVPMAYFNEDGSIQEIVFVENHNQFTF